MSARPLEDAIGGLTVRMRNQIKNAELRTVADVAGLEDRELRWKGLGPKTIEALRAVVPYSPDANALRMICQTCRFFHHGQYRVECRRHEPRLFQHSRTRERDGAIEYFSRSSWPETKHYDWCGEWKGMK